MIATVIGAVLLFFVVVFSLLRFVRGMAGFIDWLVGSVTGFRYRRKAPEESDSASLLGEADNPSASKTIQEKVENLEEPVFASKLSTPIEDVIEETILEDLKSKNKQPSIKKKVSPKSSNTKKENKSNNSAKKDIEVPTNGKSPKKKNKQKTDAATETELPVDDIGYSFFPVKGRISKKKSVDETKENEDLPTESKFKKTKEEHKTRETKQHISYTSTTYKKSVNVTEKAQKVPVLNLPEEKSQLKDQQKAEFKESKKVCSTISYANVVTNKIPETNGNFQIHQTTVEEKEQSEVINNLTDAWFNLKESKNNTSELEPNLTVHLSSILGPANEDEGKLNNENISGSDSRDLVTTKLEPDIISDDLDSGKLLQLTTYESNSEDLGSGSNILQNLIQRNTVENVSKRSSSSIEVIGEEQSNIDNYSKGEEFQQTQTQFDIITENLHKLVAEINQFKENVSDSKSSSICVIDNRTDITESEINKKEETQLESSPISENDNIYEECSFTSPTLESFCVIVKSEDKGTKGVSQLIKDSEVFAEIQSESDTGRNLGTLEQQAVQLEKEFKTFVEDTESTFRDQDSEATNVVDFIEDIIEQLEKESEENTNEIFTHQNEHEIKKIDQTFEIYNVYGINTVVQQQEETVFKTIGSIYKGEIHQQERDIEEKHTLEVFDNETIEAKITQGVIDACDSSNVNKNLNLEAKGGSSVESEELDHFVPQEKSLKYSSYLPSGILLETDRLEMASQVRVLTLNNKEHQECTLYRIEKNWAIQFRLGPSLFGRKVFLYCNYPVEAKGILAKFERDQYQLLNWVMDEGCKNADDTAAYTQILAKLAGSFHYYFTFERGVNAERHGSGFFLVDPILKYGSDEDLPLDCIQCQTVLAKNLGSFSTWEKKLQVAKESGYNMIHFTPIQELGVSNSCYSLSEQLKLNPLFKKENGKMPTFDEVKKFTARIRKDWKVTSICDIVLNHTANESEWIKIHPEVTYNCVNCPYMRPAYLLDAALNQFSLDVKKGLYEDKGIPIEVNTEEHLNAIRYHFRIAVLQPLKIEELYICDTSKLPAEFSSLARITPPVVRDYNSETEELKLLQDKEYKRLSSTVDMKLALKLYNVYRNDTFDEESRLKKCTEELKNKLDSLNNAIIQEVNEHLTAAIENVIAGIRYFRVQADGPRVKEITIKNPLVHRYFTDYGTPKNLKECEEIMYSSNGRFLMAHNGWVMNSDPLRNFAAPDSNIYIRRELIAWGDSVKLRYGDEPRDCPFLWEYMRKYVEQVAEIFDGVRLDNCHSTPIPVAEYLLDCARRVRPNLYVVAELFTNSDMTDNIFVNRLGITSLIREAMSAWDSHEEGRLVYRYGGSPVGSFYQPRVRPLVPSIAHALFLDLTHDNPSPVEKRSVFDLLPSTALVNMACCASGSNRGYDELVPHHIHVVDENREYTEWTEDENLAKGNLKYVTKRTGIVIAKKAINDIHFTLGKEGYNQVYVDQMDPDIVAVTRHRPDTHESYILVAFTAFGHPNEDAANYQRGIRPLRFEGVLDEIVLEATLSHVSTKTGGSKFARSQNFVKDSKWVNGLSEYQVTLKQHIQANESDIFEKVDSGSPNVTQLNFKNFKPGSVVVVKASLPESMRDAVKSVRTLINQFSLTKETELSSIIDTLTLADLNRIIYRCGQEERDEGFGFDTYNIPNFGSLVYAGLQGFISLLANVRPNNDLGHPMCANLRDGNWMLEFIWKRLKQDPGTKELGQWIEENTKCFNDIPRYLVPSYFDVVVTGIYTLLLEKCCNSMSKFVNHGSTFVRGLSLGSVQFGAYIKSADLPVLSPNLAPPKPPTRKNDKGESVQACITLSAGLPHFSVGYMRNWGRDTFIALRGLFILTGRYEEARQHILGYGACLRHGLIPNLLDGGRNSRFNCRDAVWWWMYCIKEYVEEAPNGINILSDKVSRIFPTDDSPAQPPGAVDQPLYDVMQEALRVHFQGLAFRERNAGRQIDEHMTDRGFNNQIGIHPETGFVFGGNEWNCGTWMDKMGSSDKAGNRGKPATPRDGSAVELIGLSKAVITWLWKLSKQNKYPYNAVERTHKNGNVTKWTFKEWSDKIQANFEKYFWVNTTPVPGEYRSDLVHKRGIYKDCYGATQDWTDFQLRCNFPIAMVAAPELFTPQQAWTALNQVEKHLLGPLGMKTLDPEDWAYQGDYDNSNDSNDPSVAHGFNYHQGPEWVWPVGFFLRAKLHFASLNGALPETLASTKVVLSKHFTELQSSVWRGLPELTNSNGSYCNDSSRTQAWSMSCILEVLHDLQKIESNQPVLIN